MARHCWEGVSKSLNNKAPLFEEDQQQQKSHKNAGKAFFHTLLISRSQNFALAPQITTRTSRSFLKPCFARFNYRINCWNDSGSNFLRSCWMELVAINEPSERCDVIWRQTHPCSVRQARRTYGCCITTLSVCKLNSLICTVWQIKCLPPASASSHWCHILLQTTKARPWVDGIAGLAAFTCLPPPLCFLVKFVISTNVWCIISWFICFVGAKNLLLSLFQKWWLSHCGPGKIKNAIGHV